MAYNQRLENEISDTRIYYQTDLTSLKIAKSLLVSGLCAFAYEGLRALIGIDVESLSTVEDQIAVIGGSGCLLGSALLGITGYTGKSIRKKELSRLESLRG